VPTLVERVTGRLERVRQRRPWVDHAVRTVQHYGAVNGNGQAGAVTFFGFLSFFPILALGFTVVGVLARLHPDLRDQMATEINTLFPGVIGDGDGQIPLSSVDTAGGTVSLVGLVGLVAVVYSGLGWLSGMRLALEAMFVVPRQEQPNLLVGKLRDLRALAVIGTTLLVSVALSGAVTGFSGLVLSLLGVDPSAQAATVLLNVVGRALAVAASTVLLMTMFRLLAPESHLPRSALLRGALLGAVGFELLKLVANLLLAQTKDTAAFQAFGVALILLVWINYFSRLVMYAAAWAYTDPRARVRRSTEAVRAPGAALTGSALAPDRAQPALGTLAVVGVLVLRALRRGGER
jgi:membrane protein